MESSASLADRVFDFVADHPGWNFLAGLTGAGLFILPFVN